MQYYALIKYELFSRFQKSGRFVGGDLLLGHRDALRFIDACAENGFVILGMAFVKATAGGLCGFGAGDNDFSHVADGEAAVEATTRLARGLIEEGFPDYADHVTFTVERADQRQEGLRSIGARVRQFERGRRDRTTIARDWWRSSLAALGLLVMVSVVSFMVFQEAKWMWDWIYHHAVRR